MNESGKHRPTTAQIKGSGFTSQNGGYTKIYINGKAHHPDDVALAVECFPDMLAALQSARNEIRAMRHAAGTGIMTEATLNQIAAALTKAGSPT